MKPRHFVLWILVAAPGAMGACGPPRPPEPWRGCLIVGAQGMLPALQRQADPGPPPLQKAPHCAPLASAGGLPDEPEAVDDLDAVLDRGRVCGPSGDGQIQHVCPKPLAHGWQLAGPPEATGQPPTCSDAPASCPNMKLTLRKEGAPPLELEFYDDPSSHRPPELAKCHGGEVMSTCYYRLGKASTLGAI
jgi:hypothetical protein